MVEVILKKDNHTEWVEEAQADGEIKKVAKIFNKGDRVTVAKGTHEAFKDRMEVVEPALMPPPPLVDRLTSLAQELASLTESEKVSLLAEAGMVEPVPIPFYPGEDKNSETVEPVSSPIPPEGDENPKWGETKPPAEKVEAKKPAEKVGAKRPARKVGAKK